ncbi:MAG: hypothetical protein Q8K60_03885 [Parachlamydiaceae bacterium]|nr:hypothetical protein [Parachlamydiaceae bacterium]
MNRGYFKWIILIAIGCVALIAYFMHQEKIRQAEPKHEKIGSWPNTPFKSYIAAVGIVESSSGNIHIGSPVNRIVDQIQVRVGNKIKTGDVLFTLEAHDLEADLFSREVEYENAVAQLKKLESLPREEDIAIADAQFKAAETEYELAKSQFERVDGLQNSGAMSQEQVNNKKYAFEIAGAKYEQAKADLTKAKLGAWGPDLEIAKLQVKQSQALVQRVQSDLERTIVRSPIDGTVLQIKIHEGEYPPTELSGTQAMIIGNTDPLHLRVSINQFDSSYYNPKAPAVAYVQGNSQVEFPLYFVHLEPYFVPKNNLSNSITEKVDTRVLQAIYCFEEGEERVYVGQQMDVFIEANFSSDKEEVK